MPHQPVKTEDFEMEGIREDMDSSISMTETNLSLIAKSIKTKAPDDAIVNPMLTKSL